MGHQNEGTYRIGPHIRRDRGLVLKKLRGPHIEGTERMRPHIKRVMDLSLNKQRR